VTMLRPQAPGLRAPRQSQFSAPYWEGCARGELRFLRCTHCQLAIADAARICWRCHSRELRWEVSGGRGRLYSWTIVWRPQTPEFAVPYAVAIVDLEEGFSIVSSIIGCTPEDLSEGMALAVEFHPSAENMMLPYFRPDGVDPGP
jgi:uncharacterized OB-fold protein